MHVVSSSHFHRISILPIARSLLSVVAAVLVHLNSLITSIINIIFHLFCCSPLPSHCYLKILINSLLTKCSSHFHLQSFNYNSSQTLTIFCLLLYMVSLVLLFFLSHKKNVISKACSSFIF